MRFCNFDTQELVVLGKLTGINGKGIYTVDGAAHLEKFMIRVALISAGGNLKVRCVYKRLALDCLLRELVTIHALLYFSKQG